MSSPNRSTSNIEDAFSSMNILNYTSVSSDYFPASSGSISFNSSEDYNIIPSNSLFYRIGEMEKDNKLKTELEKVHSQIIKLQRKQLGQRDKIAFAHYRISNLEQIIKENQARYQTDQEDL
ncbi:hypothetical protein Tco_0838162 [Tanacetum coccineum]|uniref:Uncharacterized protein n=1 Tax=Tanacetum coccineum TaxID=301880 RepID=A0ABQ5ALZ2_9ASTR